MARFMWIVCIFLLGISYCADNLQYAIYAHKRGSVPINQFQIFGERCSSTKYLEKIISRNFPGLKFSSHFGWKHGPAWFASPAEYNPGSEEYYTLDGQENYLFIIIFRHPYDWLRSIHRHPYHAKSKLYNIPIENFIRAPWEIDPFGQNRDADYIKKIDLDPVTGLPFQNILQLRTACLQNMLLIKDRALNVYYINYEMLRDFPAEIVQELEYYFGVQAVNPFIPIEYDCDSYGDRVYEFVKKPPYKPSSKLLQLINAELDLQLESSIGYPLSIKSDHPSGEGI